MASCSPGSQRGDDAVGAEAMQTLFGRHGVLQHVQTDGTHQLAVQRARRHGHLRPIHDRLLNTHTHTHTHFYNNITSHITVTTGESRDMKHPKNYVWPTFPEQMEKEREMSSVLGGTADGDTTRGRHVNISYVDFQVRSKKQKQSLLLNVAS